MKYKIYLDSSRRKSAIANREEWFETYSVYDSNGCFKKIATGAPIIINISGTYYNIEKLYEICLNENDFREFYLSVKSASNEENNEYYFYFISKSKYDNGNI